MSRATTVSASEKPSLKRNRQMNGEAQLEERPRGKRVLLASALYYPNIGGVENSLFHLSQAYRAEGVTPWILTSTGGDPGAMGHSFEVKRVSGIPVLRYKFSSLALVRALRSYVALKSLTKHYEFRAIASRDQASSVAAVLLKRRSVYLVPGIASVQHRPSGRNPMRWLNHRVSVALQRFALRRVGAVAVFSERMAEAVEAEVGRTDVHRVRPGVDESRFTPISRERIDERRKELGIEKGTNVAIAVGRFSRQKRFDLAIDAIANTPEGWHLILVGDGPLRRKLEHQVDSSDLRGRVTFTGQVTNPEWYLQMADVYVLSSDYEPFGQVLIEALACGLVVATLDPALAEVDTATGEIVPDQWLSTANAVSGESLAEAMMKVGAVVRDRNAISEWALATYSWNALANELLRLGRQAHVEHA